MKKDVIALDKKFCQDLRKMNLATTSISALTNIPIEIVGQYCEGINIDYSKGFRRFDDPIFIPLVKQWELRRSEISCAIEAEGIKSLRDLHEQFSKCPLDDKFAKTMQYKIARDLVQIGQNIRASVVDMYKQSKDGENSLKIEFV